MALSQKAGTSSHAVSRRTWGTVMTRCWPRRKMRLRTARSRRTTPRSTRAPRQSMTCSRGSGPLRQRSICGPFSTGNGSRSSNTARSTRSCWRRWQSSSRPTSGRSPTSRASARRAGGSRKSTWCIRLWHSGSSISQRRSLVSVRPSRYLRARSPT
eukprot:Amastigsp_a848068_11.p2 type:complete len:156 gc:universal Amastigsp_a848068_11:102-569(+)